MSSKLYLFAVCVFLALPVCCWAGRQLQTRYDSHVSRCEPITMSMCKGLPYNRTHFPNLMGHESQEEAEKELNQFAPLVRSNCSKDLLAFLCSLYAPVCISMGGSLEMLRPCRHICKRVRKGCVALLKTKGFAWPKSFRCKMFPKSKGYMCIDWGKQKQRKGGQGEGKKKKKSKARKQSKRSKKGGKSRRKEKKNGRKGRRGDKQSRKG